MLESLLQNIYVALLLGVPGRHIGQKGGKKLAQLYDTLSFIFRYWFLFLAAMMLLLLVLNSRAEYRERKAVMGEVGQYIGYLEIIGGAEKAETRINGRRAVRAHRIITGDIVSFGGIDAKVYLKPQKGAAHDD